MSETHLREVPIYVKSRIVTSITRQITSLLTLSVDIRQIETLKEKGDTFARIFTEQWIKIYFSPNRMLTTWRGIARARSCHVLQRGHLV